MPHFRSCNIRIIIFLLPPVVVSLFAVQWHYATFVTIIIKDSRRRFIIILFIFQGEMPHRRQEIQPVFKTLLSAAKMELKKEINNMRLLRKNLINRHLIICG